MRRVLTLILSFFIISSSHADFNQFGAGNAATGSDGSPKSIRSYECV